MNLFNPADPLSTASVVGSTGGVTLTTNLAADDTQNRSIPFVEFFTLDNLPSTPLMIKQTSRDNSLPYSDMSLNYDKSNPTYYARFGSLVDKFNYAFNILETQYPRALYIDRNSVINVSRNTASSNIISKYNPRTGTTKVDIKGGFIYNPYGLRLISPNSNDTSDRNYLSNIISDYSLHIGDKEFPIILYQSVDRNLVVDLSITVMGNPFDGSGSFLTSFFIAPSTAYMNKWLLQQDDLVKYMLNKDGFLFKTIIEDGFGNLVNAEQQYFMPFIDIKNIDTTSADYLNMKNGLLEYAKTQDTIRTNVLERKLLPSNVVVKTLEEIGDISNTNDNIDILHSSYASHFDNLDLYIRNIAYFHRATYDKRDNSPDELYKNILNIMGFRLNGDFRPDLLRLLIINAPYLLKSKGTRKAIEFICELFNIPPSMIEFNEYVLTAESVIDVERADRYYRLLFPNSTLFNYPVTVDGFPYILGNPIPYEDEGYFTFFENLFPPSFTGATVLNTGTATIVTREYWNDFDVHRQGRLSFNTPIDTPIFDEQGCYNSSGRGVIDEYPTPILDECGCELPIEDVAYQICTEVDDPYLRCNNILIDIYYLCNTSGTATIQYNTYGGYPPYTFVGAQIGDIVPTGTTVSVQATDISGCTSAPTSQLVYCIDPCAGNGLDFTMTYDCLSSISGQTGQAELSISISGGTAPYTIIGAQDGSIVNDGQLISVQVVDAIGCRTPIKTIVINCSAQEQPICNNIILLTALETTMVAFDNSNSRANVTFKVDGLDVQEYVDTVTLTSSNSFMVVSPQTTIFTNPVGADTIAFIYPNNQIPLLLTVTVDFVIILTNGCRYEYTTTLTINPGRLGFVDSKTATLTP